MQTLLDVAEHRFSDSCESHKLCCPERSDAEKLAERSRRMYRRESRMHSRSKESVAFSPPPGFFPFYCKQRHLRQSTLGRPLRGPWATHGWPLGGPRATQTQACRGSQLSRNSDFEQSADIFSKIAKLPSLGRMSLVSRLVLSFFVRYCQVLSSASLFTFKGLTIHEKRRHPPTKHLFQFFLPLRLYGGFCAIR